jgi:molybdenum cofactor synthesis domain-containing protein
MSRPPIRAAVLTVSDGVHQGTRIDKSGPALVESLLASGFEVSGPGVMPDEREQIAAWLRNVTQNNLADVVFSTGGTGVALRDVTPEAVRDVIDREIPGFGELMRQFGREKTPFASLSRGLAGTAGRVLIVALPGSPKGALESLGAILELVPHVHDLLSGRTAHNPPVDKVSEGKT